MPPNTMANPRRTPLNALAADANPYTTSLLARARAEYPFVARYNPVVTVGTGSGYAETWPIGEGGAPDTPRPKDIPLDRVGISIYRPNDFSHRDLVGELLHIDPMARETSAKLAASLTPAQLATLKKNAGDYTYSIEQGLSEDRAVQNATDGLIRGALLGQWPARAVQSMSFTPAQQALLDNLTGYLKQN